MLKFLENITLLHCEYIFFVLPRRSFVRDFSYLENDEFLILKIYVYSNKIEEILYWFRVFNICTSYKIIIFIIVIDVLYKFHKHKILYKKLNPLLLSL